MKDMSCLGGDKIDEADSNNKVDEVSNASDTPPPGLWRHAIHDEKLLLNNSNFYIFMFRWIE